MDICNIGGREYAVVITEIEENFNILYSSNTGRNLNGEMILDPIGTYIGHKITVKRKAGHEEEFDELFDYVSQPRYDGIVVKMVHNQTSIEYEAYISNGTRKINTINVKNEKVYWGEMQLNIVPLKAQVLPL